MSRENPKWRELYRVLQPTLRGAESIPAGEAFKAANGGTAPNYFTAHQWKRDMDRNLRGSEFREPIAPQGYTSTTEVAYRLDPPDQSLPPGISPNSVPGRIFQTLAVAAGELVRPGKILDAVWTGPDRVGSQGSLEVGICELRTAGARIVSSGCILLRDYDGCEADLKPRRPFDPCDSST